MLHCTRGIALHTARYSETSIIAQVYTSLFGLQSYIIKGARKHGSKIRPGLFQPLTLLELTVYHKEKSSLQTVREVHNIHPCPTIYSDIRKSSMALFMAELIHKSIHEEEPNPELFNFLTEAILHLDGDSGNFPVFHLFFAVQLTRFLGFFPQDDRSEEKKYFHLGEGHFEKYPENPELMLDESSSLFLSRLLKGSYDTLHEMTVPHNERTQLLEQVLRYYRIHLAGFREIRSHTVLRSVLS
jgi:DNA repair protein RecO (recombination protein O)